MSLAGKVALITGGTGGFGRAFAAALLKENAAAVCLVDIAKDGNSVATNLASQFKSQDVSYKHCDITDYDAFKGTFEFCKQKYGRLDIVCNNAGIASNDYDLPKSIKGLRLNLEAVFYGTRLGMEYMDKSTGGHGGVIVNVASMAAFIPAPSSMVYSGTKSGVVGLSRAAALDFKQNGVRVNSLCPTFADTPILDSNGGMARQWITSQNIPILKVDMVTEGFMQLVQNTSLNGMTMRVTAQKGIDFFYFNAQERAKAASKL